MKFTILLRNGDRFHKKGGNWVDTAREAEVDYGRLNLKGIIWEYKENYEDADMAVRHIALERVFTEQLVLAFCEEAKNESKMQGLFDDLKQATQ